MDEADPRKKSLERPKNGGARPGCGAKCKDSEPFSGNIDRQTRIQLERFAKEKGIKRQKGKPFWNILMKELLKGVQVSEPEYLSLIPKNRMTSTMLVE